MTNNGPANPEHLVAGYQLCASTEGKSPKSIAVDRVKGRNAVL